MLNIMKSLLNPMAIAESATRKKLYVSLNILLLFFFHHIFPLIKFIVRTQMYSVGVVLVHPNHYNKVPESGWLIKQQSFIS